MQFYYSKSRYVAFCDCRKRLWCEHYKPQEKKEIDNQSILDNGNLIGDLARNYFGPFVLVESENNNLAEMVKQTSIYLQEGYTNICEASFFYKNNYCACDILHRNEDGSFDIYEVKSTTKVVKHYYDDIAYQTYVLTHCGLKIRKTFLMHVNSFYVFKEKLDIKKYFKIEDLTIEVMNKLIEIEPMLELSDQVLSSNVPPVVSLTKQCEECSFKEYCYKENGVQEDSVLNLYFNRNKYAQLKQGIKNFKDILANDVKLNEIQKRQIDFHYDLITGEYINVEEVENFLQQIKYPIYFLDFESNQYAVPRFNGTRPYSQVCFQYSLHILQNDDSLQHLEFLGDERKDYREDLIKQLVHDLSDCGSIISYNKSFEMTRIKEMSQLFPAYAEKLNMLLPRFVDLADIFQKGYYYNKAMGKSFSIKSVLPALFPNDPSLDYHQLDGIHNGSEAMHSFDNLLNLSITEREKTRQSLLKYCCLDTYAMVKIYNFLVAKIKK